ncbi:unnamed protein product [Calicophoron daubneyi]|uniref:ZMYM2-like/QRICH1 C-terminal domain-containing protein n=1 Tax=Calicophoron daubneyi TaxID=300641 RepID=A0AAV2TXY9_CALDB
MPVTIISTTPTKSALIKTNEEQFGSRAGNGGSPCNDDIRIDLRKSGGGPGRSVRIELRDLLDLVLAAARPSATTSSDGSLGSQRPPVGLVTQLLWRSRALDDRGPWILTFSMWWLMQHYFGVGSRMHHVRLRWGHLRIVSGVRDPMTNELCDAIEYVGPPEFTTVKACAVLETTAESTRVRRVYPSSGWAEAEITVASALTCEDIAERPRMRPLDTEPDVPTVCRRPGPNFVELFKAFAERRQDQSLLSSAPFYVQPLQSSSGLVNKSTATWFSVSALGKNRIGALMRNIVDKVVRPNLSRVATAATAVAKKACIAVAHRAALAIPVPLDGPTPDFLAHRRTLTVKLACLLGLTVASLNEPEDQSPPDSACSSPCVDEAAADSFTLSASCQIDVSPSPAVDMNELMGDLIRDNSSSISSALPRLGVKSSEMSERSNAGATHHAIGISPSNPTAGLMLLTSADGHSTVQSSAPPGSLIILPTQSSTGTVGFVQPNLSSQQSQHRTVIHAAQPATVLTTPGTQFVKTQNLSSYPARSAASQQVAYLTSGAGINQSPVNLIFLSTNTSQGTAILPSSVMLSNFQGQQQQHQQPTVAVYQSGQGTYQTATSLTQLPTDRIRSVLVRRGFGGTINILSPSKSEATHLLCSTSVPHSSTTTTANVTTTIPMGSQLFYSTSNTVNSDYTYPEQTIIKQEQASPGIGVYDTSSSTPTVTSNPVILQAVTPDGQVIHIAQAATHEGQKQQQIFIQSQHSNQVYARTNNMNTMVTMYDENGGAMGNLGSGGSDCEVIFSPVGNECGSNQTVDQTTYEIMEQPVVLDSTTAAGKADTTSASTCTTLPSPNSSLLSSKRGSGVFGRTQLPSVIHITRGTPAVRIISSKAISQPERVNSSTLPPLSSMTCQLVPPEPKQEQLHTLQSVINTASAYQCADFPSYVEQLFRSGVLSARNPWCLNFTAWFINSLVFEIENRTEHVNLRWGDFQLCQTFDGTEFIYFINHVNNKEYYLAESPPSPYSLGYDDDGCAGGKPGSRTSVRCPCPVAIFKALREHRPTHCLEPYSKFYLQPRNTDNSENSTKAGIKPTPSTSDNTDWFTEHAWGKNKLGGLFAEAAKLAKLPMIWLRKHRSRNFFPGGGGSGMGALGHHSPPRGVGFNSRSQSCATNKMGSSTKASSTPNTRKSRPRSDAKRRRLSTPTVTTSEPDELIHSSSSSQTPAPPIQLPSSSTILKRKASSFLSPNC